MYFCDKFENMNYFLHKLRYGPWFKFKRHLFDIKFHSLKQHNDFLESTICLVLYRLGLFTFQYDSPIGIELWLSSQKDFDEKELERMGQNAHNLRIFKTKCELHLFQKARCFGNRAGIFLGILVTHEDYYYIFMDEYGHKWYESCVGKLEFIND